MLHLAGKEQCNHLAPQAPASVQPLLNQPRLETLESDVKSQVNQIHCHSGLAEQHDTPQLQIMAELLGLHQSCGYAPVSST